MSAQAQKQASYIFLSEKLLRSYLFSETASN